MDVSAEGVVDSSCAFFPHPTAASAIVLASSATIARANHFRIFTHSPPLELAAPGSSGRGPNLLVVCIKEGHHTEAVSPFTCIPARV